MQENDLTKLIKNTKITMSGMKYSEKVISSHNRVFVQLENFAEIKGFTEFSETLGELFLKEIYQYTPRVRLKERPIMTTMAYEAIKRLSQFKIAGVLHHKAHKEISEEWTLNDIEIIKLFLEHKRKLGCVEKTIKIVSQRLQRFYDFLRAHNMTSITESTVEIFSLYWTSMQGLSQAYCRDRIYVLGSFLRFLYNNQYMDNDLSTALPKVSGYKKQRLPAIWSNEDIEKLLSSIDRKNPVGKRDYAFLVLVIELGLRTSDISNLTLSNLKWDRNEIEISQHKTGKINVCPMTKVAGWALIEYLRDGRPKSNLPYVFLTIKPPYKKFGETTAVGTLTRYRQRAGILFTGAAPSQGMHSLRHTLARRLLEKDVPLEVISDIMGHTQVESSSPYLKIDIDGMRQCVLSLEEIKKYANENI